MGVEAAGSKRYATTDAEVVKLHAEGIMYETMAKMLFGNSISADLKQAVILDERFSNKKGDKVTTVLTGPITNDILAPGEQIEDHKVQFSTTTDSYTIDDFNTVAISVDADISDQRVDFDTMERGRVGATQNFEFNLEKRFASELTSFTRCVYPSSAGVVFGTSESTACGAATSEISPRLFQFAYQKAKTGGNSTGQQFSVGPRLQPFDGPRPYFVMLASSELVDKIMANSQLLEELRSPAAPLPTLADGSPLWLGQIGFIRNILIVEWEFAHVFDTSGNDITATVDENTATVIAKCPILGKQALTFPVCKYPQPVMEIGRFGQKLHYAVKSILNVHKNMYNGKEWGCMSLIVKQRG